MKKQRRGLRIREYFLMVVTLWLVPYWLVGCGLMGFPELTWRSVGLCVVWSFIALVLILLAENRLEARGRYVDSGADISWEDVFSWCDQDGYKVNLLFTFGLCLIIAIYAAIDMPDWSMAIIAAFVAWHAYLAVKHKPNSELEKS